MGRSGRQDTVRQRGTLGGERNGRQEGGGGEVEWKARAKGEAELKAGVVKAWKRMGGWREGDKRLEGVGVEVEWKARARAEAEWKAGGVKAWRRMGGWREGDKTGVGWG
jgi:hypothetical protein